MSLARADNWHYSKHWADGTKLVTGRSRRTVLSCNQTTGAALQSSEILPGYEKRWVG